jgi:tetratricopeptide (TPR) repeat protein
MLRPYLALVLVLVFEPSANSQARSNLDSPPITYLELLKQANEKTRAKQWSDAAELWTRVVQINPVEGDFWALLAHARYENKEYRKAIPAYEKALELRSGFPCNQAYSLARCYGFLGEKEPSFRWLEKAFAMGYRKLDTARNDRALELLWPDARYQNLVGLVDTGKMSRDEGWRYDLQFLARELKRRSYDPFRKISREEFDASVDKLHNAIPSLTDLQISIEMMKFVAKGGDGHTTVYGFWERPEFLQTIPIELFLFEEGLFIIAADSRYQDLLGAQVLRFGSHSIAQVLQALDPLISRDNDLAALKVMGLMRMRNLPLLHALGVIPDPDKVILTITDRDGKGRAVTLPADVRIPSRKLWDGLPPGWKGFHDLSPEPLPLYLKNIYAPFWFEYLPGTRLVYFQFNRVTDDSRESLAQFSDRLFKFINEHEVEKLVIDLRWNPGGTTELLPPLIHGLIRCEKINQRGKLFTIIGRRTYSAAQNAATFIERHTRAIFVGEPTGSSPNFIGEESEATFELPFSKLNVNVSYLFWQSSWPNDYRPWIAPLLYTPPRFESYRANRDSALEAVLSYR